jgi:hypothetical protein
VISFVLLAVPLIQRGREANIPTESPN